MIRLSILHVLICCLCLLNTSVSAFVAPSLDIVQPLQSSRSWPRARQLAGSYVALSVSKTDDAVLVGRRKSSTSESNTDDDGAATVELVESVPESVPPSRIESVGSIKDEVAAIAASDSGDGALEGLAWRGVVVVLCALWASNFAVAKLVMGEPGVDSSLYAVTRFSVAALALLPGAIAAVKRSGLDAEIARGAAACGSWVAFGYLGQTLGLLTTTASRSCVICSLHCVFVACIAELWRVNRATEAGRVTSFDTKRLLPAAIAVAGVAIVELQGAAGAPTVGDALSFAQPIGFGMGYLTLEELMARRPEAALPVSAIKLVMVALASFGLFELSPLLNHGLADGLQMLWPLRVPDFGAILNSPVALGGILYTGLVTTALALWIESIAFARVPATDASIILTTEPLFAAAVGAVTLGETFGLSDYAGASLIVGGCALAALMDNSGDDMCVIEEDPKDQICEPPRKWPFWGF